MRPSTFTVRRTVPVATSTKLAVMRTRSPIFWKPPTTTQVAPSRRPTSIARDSSRLALDARCRTASKMRSRPMTVTPSMFLRSEVTVSAMPTPIQSSAASRVMFTNVMTATERSIADAVWAAIAVAAPLALTVNTRSSSPAILRRSASMSRAVW